MSSRPIPHLVVLGFVTLLAAGCGPSQEVSYVATEHPVDLLYGQAANPSTPPRATQVPQVTRPAPQFPGLVVPPGNGVSAQPSTSGPVAVITTPSATPVLAPTCPTASPNQVTAQPGADGMTIPADSTYSFRRTGTVADGSKPVQSLNGDISASVHDAKPSSPQVPNDPSFTFAVTETAGSVVSTFTYEVENGGQLPGLKVVGVSTSDGVNPTTTFQPQPPVRIFDLPAVIEGGGAQDQGVDPLTQAQLQVIHQIQTVARIDACGQLITGWVDRITGDYKIPNGPNLDDYVLDGAFVVAPQFGCLIVSAEMTVTKAPPPSEPQAPAIGPTPNPSPSPVPNPLPSPPYREQFTSLISSVPRAGTKLS